MTVKQYHLICIDVLDIVLVEIFVQYSIKKQYHIIILLLTIIIQRIQFKLHENVFFSLRFIYSRFQVYISDRFNIFYLSKVILKQTFTYNTWCRSDFNATISFFVVSISLR